MNIAPELTVALPVTGVESCNGKNYSVSGSNDSACSVYLEDLMGEIGLFVCQTPLMAAAESHIVSRAAHCWVGIVADIFVALSRHLCGSELKNPL